jgi:purine nucleosidase/pyrimidine-specific ribonucleoside hydrolase
MQKILIDTDPGQDIDDLLAIIFALKRPELDIRAITTVTQPSVKRARLVKRLLRYMHRTDIPVAAGMELPLRVLSAEEIKYQDDPLITMNHYAFAEPEDSADNPGASDAVDLIIETIEKYPGEIVLACIAPLTNIACALRKRPSIAGKIKYIAMMGGELALNRAEHNIAFDYISSALVLNSGIKIYMGTWDVTRRFFFTMEECKAFHRHHAPVSKALSKAIELWHPAQKWKPGPVMYDIFPILWAFDQSYYTVKPMSVQVETKGEFTCGMTVQGGSRPNIEVTTDIRADAIKDLYLKTVLD